jgi:hypothetical protein
LSICGERGRTQSKKKENKHITPLHRAGLSSPFIFPLKGQNPPKHKTLL